tara:strand:+ start:910 stop:1185 length:276 start_codon:yes stop_codon:yes gene_type:complete
MEYSNKEIEKIQLVDEINEILQINWNSFAARAEIVSKVNIILAYLQIVKQIEFTWDDEKYLFNEYSDKIAVQNAITAAGKLFRQIELVNND